MHRNPLTLALAFVAGALLIVIAASRGRATPATGLPSVVAEQAREARPATIPSRTEVPRSRPSATLASGTQDFDAAFAHFVALGGRQKACITAGDMAGAERLNPEIQTVLQDLLDTYADAEARVLTRFTKVPASGRTADEEVLAIACEVVVTTGLERRHALAKAHGERAALDGFVAMVLTNIAADQERAEAMSLWLVDRPYLGLVHEPAVMELVRLACSRPKLASPASALLRTLWTNLEASGVRRPEEIAALALLAKDSESSATRLAALETLLCSRDGRFRALVLQEAQNARDGNLARELASAAALKLPPQEALDLLIRLAPLAPGGMIGPFMSLGHRDPGLLAKCYERMLADDVDPRVRAELVTGAGFEGGPNLELARTAFEYDRDPEVRSRAIFVLTARAGAALGEKTIHAALDDRTFATDPVRLAGLVIALENLVGGDPNVVDRVSRRLLARSELLESDRRKLEGIVARALPGAGK